MSPLAKLMSESGITVTLTHLHVIWFDEKGEREKNPMDKWYALVEYRGKSFGTFYRTGMGHRVFSKFPAGSKWTLKGNGRYQSNLGDGTFYTLEQMVAKNYLQLPKEGPKADEVLHCLLTDAQSGSESFRDFCDNYGMDRDSLSALKTYLACQETRDAMLRLFGGQLLSQLIEAGQDM
jgi:hypothetical protein